MSPDSFLNILSAVTAARHLRVDGGSAVLGPNPTCGPSPWEADGNAANGDAADATFFAAPNLSDAPSSQCLEPPTPSPVCPAAPVDADDAAWNHHGGVGLFRPGSLVELYGARGAYAAPALITGQSSAKYYLQNLLTGGQSAVDPAFVHPYEIHGEGTEAYCVLGASPEIDVAPCRVKSHFKREGSPVAYFVTYEDEDEGEPTRRLLPYSKVLRRLRTSGPV